MKYSLIFTIIITTITIFLFSNIDCQGCLEQPGLVPTGSPNETRNFTNQYGCCVYAEIYYDNWCESIGVEVNLIENTTIYTCGFFDHNETKISSSGITYIVHPQIIATTTISETTVSSNFTVFEDLKTN